MEMGRSQEASELENRPHLTIKERSLMRLQTRDPQRYVDTTFVTNAQHLHCDVDDLFIIISK